MKMKKQNLLILASLSVLAVLAVFTNGCADNAGDTQTIPTQIVDINDSHEAYTLIQDNKANEDFILIDVRTPEEYADGHIENAINLDYQSPSFREAISALDRSKTYFIYCRTGRRSSGALEVMQEFGFGKLYHLTGGIKQWVEAGLPVVK